MKVILLKDVRKVGKKFDVKDVSDGYALNFLIPQKLAEVSNVPNTKRFDTLRIKDEAMKKVNEDLLAKNIKSLENVVITLEESANDKGNLFKGIHKEELIIALKKQASVDLAPEHIVLEKPIKEVGDHMIDVKVQDKTAQFKLTISAK